MYEIQIDGQLSRNELRKDQIDGVPLHYFWIINDRDLLRWYFANLSAFEDFNKENPQQEQARPLQQPQQQRQPYIISPSGHPWPGLVPGNSGLPGLVPAENSGQRVGKSPMWTTPSKHASGSKSQQGSLPGLLLQPLPSSADPSEIALRAANWDISGVGRPPESWEEIDLSKYRHTDLLAKEYGVCPLGTIFDLRRLDDCEELSTKPVREFDWTQLYDIAFKGNTSHQRELIQDIQKRHTDGDNNVKYAYIIRPFDYPISPYSVVVLAGSDRLVSFESGLLVPDLSDARKLIWLTLWFRHRFGEFQEYTTADRIPAKHDTERVLHWKINGKAFERNAEGTYGSVKDEVCRLSEMKRAQVMKRKLKKKFIKKIFGYLARCEFWLKLRFRFWILQGMSKF